MQEKEISLSCIVIWAFDNLRNKFVTEKNYILTFMLKEGMLFFYFLFLFQCLHYTEPHCFLEMQTQSHWSWFQKRYSIIFFFFFGIYCSVTIEFKLMKKKKKILTKNVKDIIFSSFFLVFTLNWATNSWLLKSFIFLICRLYINLKHKLVTAVVLKSL